MCKQRGSWHTGAVRVLGPDTMGELLTAQVSVFPHTKRRILTHGLVVKGDTRVYIRLLEHSRWSLNVRWLPIHRTSLPLGIDPWDSLNFGGEVGVVL